MVVDSGSIPVETINIHTDTSEEEGELAGG